MTRAFVPMPDSDGPAEILICRGPGKGCAGRQEPCPDCYRVTADDPRTTQEIFRDMERGDA